MKMTLEFANTLIKNTLDHARSIQSSPLAVMILDAGGHPVAFEREDNSSYFRFDIARAKANAALGMGVDTKILAEKSANNSAFFASLSSMSNLDIPLSGGGKLIKTKDNEIIGAIGISGDTGPVDEACASAGIQATLEYHGV